MKKIFILLCIPLSLRADADAPSPAPLYINVTFQSPNDLNVRAECGFRCVLNQYGEYIPEQGFNSEKVIARLHREEHNEAIVYTICASLTQLWHYHQAIRYCVMKDPSPAHNPTGILGSQIYRRTIHLNEELVESLPQLGDGVQLTFRSHLQGQN